MKETQKNLGLLHHFWYFFIKNLQRFSKDESRSVRLPIQFERGEIGSNFRVNALESD